MSEAAAGHPHLLRGQYAVDSGDAPQIEIPPPADQMHMYHFRHISCCFIATSPALRRLSPSPAGRDADLCCKITQKFQIVTIWQFLMYYFSRSADALPPRHAAHAVDTPALMGDGVPSVDGRKNAAAGAQILARSSRRRGQFPPVQKKCDLRPPKCKNHRLNTVQVQTVCQDLFTPVKRFVFPPPTTSPRPTP